MKTAQARQLGERDQALELLQTSSAAAAAAIAAMAQELVRSEAEMLALETTVGGLAACLPRVLVLGQQRRGDVAVDATGAAHGGRPKTTFSHRSPGVVSMTIPPPSGAMNRMRACKRDASRLRVLRCRCPKRGGSPME